MLHRGTRKECLFSPHSWMYQGRLDWAICSFNFNIKYTQFLIFPIGRLTSLIISNFNRVECWSLAQRQKLSLRCPAFTFGIYLTKLVPGFKPATRHSSIYMMWTCILGWTGNSFKKIKQNHLISLSLYSLRIYFM